MNLEWFLINLPELVPAFCESLQYVEFEEDTDIARLSYMIYTLHEESFCGMKVDLHCGDMYMDALWSAVKQYKNRIEALYGAEL